MANKTLKKKVQAKPATSKPTNPVAESARDLWFAGLGAFSVAQTESGKLIEQGSKLFEKLVSEGTRIEKKSLNLAETAVDDIKTDVEKRLEDVRQQATENWDKFGNVFDERVSGTLERLGIPTTKDLDTLSGRVQEMSKKATNSWKQFEGLFEKRVSAALKSLRVPATEDLSKLESVFEERVSGAFGKLEASTADEIKKLNSGVQDVSRQVSENWGKLGSLVEDRVSEVLGGLGIPSAGDINKLSAELQKLSRQVAAMEKQIKASAAPREAVAKKTVAVRTATSMTVADKKKAAEAISKMKPARKPEIIS